MRYLLFAFIVLGTLAVWRSAAGAAQDQAGTAAANFAAPRPERVAPGAAESFAPGPAPRENGALECDSTASQLDLIESAREMFVAGNYPLAEMLYQCVLSRDPNDVTAILELSVVYESAGDLQHASALASRAAVLRPFDQEIIDKKRELSIKLAEKLESEANALIGRGAHEAALPKLSALLRERPGDAELHYKKALCYLKLGDAVGALLEIDKAAAIRMDIRYSVLRSKAVELGKTQDVGALVREAEALCESDRAEDRERTLALLSQILARDPGHAWARAQFMLLSNGERTVAPGNTRPQPAERTAIVTRAQSAGRTAAAFFTGILETIERRIVALVLALVVLVVLGSPLTSMIVRGFEPRQRLSGRLTDFNIQEILSLVHSQGISGVLRVYGGKEKARVYLSEGEIRHCVSGKTTGRDAIRKLLTQANGGYFVLTALPKSFKRTMDVPFSLVLMDIGDRSFFGPRDTEAQTPCSPKRSKMKSLLEEKK